MRACSWAVRGAHDGSRGVATHLQRGPRCGLVHNQREQHAAAVSTPVGHAGGASVNTQTGGARRLLRCTSTPFGSALGASAAIGQGARLADAARCTTVCRVGQLCKSRVLKNESQRGKMRALTVGLEHKQSAESAHPTPPSPRVRQFHLPRVVLRVLSGHGHHGHHGHPKLNLEK